MVSKPSTLTDFLSEIEARPKKSLSQNFLIDKNILQKICKAADIQKGDHVLEIGPGPGALTEHLLEAGASVTAVEKDPVFAKELSRFNNPNLRVFSEDILRFDFANIKAPIKVVSNLPYHLTSPILGRLLPNFTLFSSLTLMVQKEVGERIVSERAKKSYSSFSLFCQYFSRVRYCFTVSPNSFYPKPKIQSCILQFTLKQQTNTPELFFPLIRASFGQKRKMLRASLGEKFGKDQITSCLADLNLSPTARPSDLSIEHFLDLARALSSEDEGKSK